MHRKLSTLALCLTTLVAGILPACPAGAASWSSFQPALFAGIYLTPTLTTGSLHYELRLDAHPAITIGGETYGINWIQAFYVVGKDQSARFDAANGATVTDWTWEARSNPGQIAGWQGPGSSRLYPGQSKLFGFAELDLADNAVLPGLHLGYQDGKSEKTDWFKGTLPSVPEPPSILAFATGATGLVGLSGALRRARRRQ